MSKAKYTPWPWEYDVKSAIVTHSHSGFIVTKIDKSKSQNNAEEAERDADGKLIAAAPETIEALENLLNKIKDLYLNDVLKSVPNELFNQLSAAMRQADKAIKKATE